MIADDIVLTNGPWWLLLWFAFVAGIGWAAGGAAYTFVVTLIRGWRR